MSYHAQRSDGRPGAPLVFTFHGTGGDETQLHGLAEEVMPGAHVVSPRGDVDEHGHLRFFRRTGEGVYDMEDLALRSAAMAAFIETETARAGASEVVGLGYSNGANILAAVALIRPELVGRLVLMHPLIPWAPAPQPGLAGRRVLITAGERDPICPPDATRALARYLRDQGAEVTEAWHPGGHAPVELEFQAVGRFVAEPGRLAAPRTAD